MQIGGTAEKLPNYLRKIHGAIQKDGTKGDAMMFDKILAIQQQNSAEMRNLMIELNKQRAEEANIHREETQLLMNELWRTQA